MESCLKAETARSKVQWCQKTSLHSTPIYTVQVRVTEYSMSRNTHRNAKSMGIPKAFVHSINCCLCKNLEDKIKSLILNIFYFQLQESAMVVLLIAHYFWQVIHSEFNQYSEINGPPTEKQFVHYKNEIWKRSKTMFWSFVIGHRIRNSLNQYCLIFPWRQSFSL